MSEGHFFDSLWKWREAVCVLQMTLLFVPCLQGYNAFDRCPSLHSLCFCSSLVHG